MKLKRLKTLNKMFIAEFSDSQAERRMMEAGACEKYHLVELPLNGHPEHQEQVDHRKIGWSIGDVNIVIQNDECRSETIFENELWPWPRSDATRMR